MVLLWYSEGLTEHSFPACLFVFSYNFTSTTKYMTDQHFNIYIYCFLGISNI